MTTMTKQEKRSMKVTSHGEREIRIERVFDAARDRVWRAYTEPSLLKQWWGRGNELDIVRFEFERGGHWRFEERSEGQTHGFEGRFGDITPQQQIVQTFEWDGMPPHPARRDARRRLHQLLPGVVALHALGRRRAGRRADRVLCRREATSDRR